MNRASADKSEAATAAHGQRASQAPAVPASAHTVQLKQALAGQPFAAQEEMLAPPPGDGSTERRRAVQRKPPEAESKSPPAAAEPSAKLTQYAAAKTRHQANLSTLATILKVGATETGTPFGDAWTNACQWIAAGKTRLHALTQTHDAAERAKALGHPGEVAMFGATTPVPTMSEYAVDDQKNGVNIECDDLDTVGLRKGGPSRILIIEPSTRSADAVKEIIVHEVQHDADGHGSGSFERYASEFCAYWIDQSYSEKSSATGTGKDGQKTDDGTELKGFDNARQQAIYKQVHNGYPYVAKAWKSDAAFRQKVLALKKPEGRNLVNSPRLDDLQRLFSNIFVDMKDVRAALGKLTEGDKAAIRHESMRKHWLAMIEASLDTEEIAEFKKAVGLS